MKILKPNRAVIVLSGKYAGRKALVIKVCDCGRLCTHDASQNYDDGSQERPYPHALVAGIDKAPRKVTRLMSKKKLASRNKLRPFLKVYNYNHMLPTR
jgi:large subunit ribosomal protein L27e